jgi:serine phosphatase RsbU (regulator of sigma subunit)
MNRSANDQSSRDGMDMALCVYDRNKGEIDYAGAFNPLYHVREGKMTVYSPDKIALGSPEEEGKAYTVHNVKLVENDMVYIFSDGYPDQFGGPKGKKFMYKPFRNLLHEASALETDKQHEMLSQRMNNWRMGKGSERHEQIDDILVIGVRHTSG